MPAQVMDESEDSADARFGTMTEATMLSTNGPGSILIIDDSRKLEDGHQYVAVAMPREGCVFKGWN